MVIGLLGCLVVAGMAVTLVTKRPHPKPRSERMHVVVVIGCTVRRDQLTPYGGPAETTPHLARLARSGARFSDAVTAAPWTRPSSTALLTGRHPLSVGMVDPTPGVSHRVLSPKVTTLAERFEEAGYATVGATTNPNLNGSFGFAQGFDHYDEAAGLWRAGKMARRVPGRAVVDRALSVVRRLPPEQPLYLRMVLTDAHKPYTWVTDADVRRMAAPDVPRSVERYRAALRHLDDAVARLTKGLARLGYDERNTLFVFVNDHGEGLDFPEHHGSGHGVLTYRSTTAMPWIVRGPGVATGHVIDGLASGVDLVPTVTELAAIGGYEGAGRSWAAQVRGEAKRTTRERAFSDTWFRNTSRAAVFGDEVECHRDWAPALRSGSAAVRSSPPMACYDRRTDPMALHPLAGSPDHPLMEELDAWRRDRLAEFRAWEDHLQLDDASLPVDQLRALGYVR